MPLSLFPPAPLEESLGQPDLDVELTGDGFPLPVLLAFVPDIWESSGELTLRGGIGGSLLAPVPDLELVVEGGRVCYQRTGICYEQVTVAAEVDTEQLTLEDLSFETVPQIVNPIDLVRGRGLQAGGQRGKSYLHAINATYVRTGHGGARLRRRRLHRAPGHAGHLR